ncbi:MAG: phosphatase PAP2 family protein [Halorubrum sp.]
MLFVLVAALVACVLVCFAVLVPTCLGVDRVRSVVADRRRLRGRLRTAAPFVGGLAVVVALNKGLLDRTEAFAYQYGVEATAWFHAVEGNLVGQLQAALPGWSLYYFGPMYVLGYAVLLTFPLVAYLFVDDPRALQTLVMSYAINYAVAVVCYAAVLAYGPRNYPADPIETDPTSVTAATAAADQPLFNAFPAVTELTSQVNVHTNVFPSLHASLSLTVFVLAVSTRRELPRWTAVAGVVAASVVVSTMYLGIHWAVDVVAGAALAVGSVAAASRIVDRVHDGNGW